MSETQLRQTFLFEEPKLRPSYYEILLKTMKVISFKIKSMCMFLKK